MFTPPHWNHENIKLPMEEVDTVISKFKESIPLRHNNYSSFYKGSTHPESIWSPTYKQIVDDLLSNVGVYQTSKFYSYFWAQLYLDNSLHTVHNHFYGAHLSFVHFIKVTDKPLFRFTNRQGDFYIPKQNEGDFICFPSWVWHEVIANESNQERFVVAGNITITDMEKMK